jgi:quinol monooxygenase YgiN
MGKIVIVCYKPKEGKAEALKELILEHVPILRSENLATAREPIIMQAKDGTMIEVFEWVSEEAIQQAHTNKAVHEMWKHFSGACDYVAPPGITEFQNIFSTFEAVK